MFSNTLDIHVVVRRRRRRVRQAVLAVCLSAVAAIVLAGPAAAAPASNSQVVHVTSNEAQLGGFQLQAPIVIPDPLPIVLTNLTVSAKAQWTGDITTNVAWDGDKVRQGADLDVSRIASLASGTLRVSWELTGEIDSIDFGPVTIDTDNVSCDPTFSGGGFDCDADSPGFALPGAIPSPLGFFVPMLGIGVNFHVTPAGAVVTRGFAVGGNQVVGPDDLSLTSGSQSEKLSVPCAGKAGDSVGYKLDPYHWKPATTASEQVELRIVEALDPFGVTALFNVAKIKIGSAI